MNVSKILSDAAFHKSNQTAIIFNDSKFTYSEINNSSNALANYLTEKGLKKGNTITAILPNCPEFALVYFAAMKIGAVFMPVDTKLGEEEILSLLKDSNTKLCFTYSAHPLFKKLNQITNTLDISSKEFKNIVNNPTVVNDITTETNEEETALYLHTSGVTNRPKIVELSYSNLDCFPKAMKQCVVLREKEVLGIVLPMSHISGPIILNLLLAEKCKLVIIDSINPVSLFENISKHKITYFHAVPPVFNLMLKSGFADSYDTSSLDLIAMMGTSVPVSVMNAFKAAFPHVTVLQGYGLTETSPLITLTRREDADLKRASIGTPVENAQVKVIDENGSELKAGEIGELIVKGPMVMKGYLSLPEQNKERLRNGYFYTNDLVKYDEDYYFYHMGRRDDLIVLSNGQKVYPAEIQNIILTSPEIMECAVLGVHSNKEKGNIIHACVVPVSQKDINPSMIRDLCSAHLPNFKIPKKFSVLEALPKTSTGKIDIQNLRKHLSGNSD